MAIPDPAIPDPSSVRLDGPWTHRDVHANGIRFHVAECGPTAPGTSLVVLLHGFADFWWSWRHQLTGLAEAGYRAVAVDLRGYGDTDKPPRGYDGWTLSGDVAGLIRALGHSEATLVGHADGGLVCWATAMLHPRLVRLDRADRLAAPDRTQARGAARPGAAHRVAAGVPDATSPRGFRSDTGPNATVSRSNGPPRARRARMVRGGRSSPMPPHGCGRRSRSPARRTLHWNTSAGGSAASGDRTGTDSWRR